MILQNTPINIILLTRSLEILEYKKVLYDAFYYSYLAKAILNLEY